MTNTFEVFAMTMQQVAQVSRETTARMKQIAKAMDVPPEILGIDDGA